jgi:hypothetical protein
MPIAHGSTTLRGLPGANQGLPFLAGIDYTSKRVFESGFSHCALTDAGCPRVKRPAKCFERTRRNHLRNRFETGALLPL